MRRIYTLLALFFLLLGLHAQSLMFKHLEVSDGLSNNSVRCIYKDSEGLMWFGTLAGLNCYDGYTFKVFTHQENNPNSLPDNYIENIVEQPDGMFWIKTAKGYVLFDKAKEVFQSDLTPFMTSLGSKGNPGNVFVDSAGNVWIYVVGEGCYRYNRQKEIGYVSCQKYNFPPSDVSDMAECKEGILLLYDTGLLVCIDRDKLNVKWIKKEVQQGSPQVRIDFSLFVDREDCIWIYGIEGVWAYDLRTGKWNEEVTARWKNRSDFVHTITQDARGRIWMGKDYSGIDILEKSTWKIRSVVADKDTDRGLSHNTVYTLYTDRDGIVWAGTYKKGISYYGESIFKFDIDYVGDVTSIESEGEDRAWLGTNDNGVLLWNFSLRRVEKHFKLGEAPVVTLLKASDGKLWVGTFNGGLYCIEGNRVRSFKAGEGGQLVSNKIWALQEDRKGNIWIGFLDAGIQCLHSSGDTFETIDLKKAGLDDYHVASLCLTDEDDLVIGTASQGVALFDLESRKIKTILREKDSTGLAHNEINQVFKDSRGLIWIATRGGLDIYDVKTGKLKGLSDIMPDNGGIIAGIAEDANGDMWITSARQLVHLNVAKKENGDYRFVPHTYNEKDGLQNSDFNIRSIRLLNNNAILVGGLYGINVFTPENVHYNKQLPKVFFTRLSLFNKVVQVGERIDGSVLLPKNLDKIGKLTLKYKQNIFTISVASDNLSLPEKTCYMYQLKGFSKEWLSLPEGIHSVTFTNLAPGNYVLNVKAVNSDGYMGEEVAHLNIEVLPPFWMSWWAYVLYVLAGIGLLFLARRQILKRERERFRLHQIELEVAKNEEVNNMKFRLFTNISHELRTPLTLIIAPLEQMLKEADNDESRKMRLQLMYRNAHRLLMLVNQLLDFRKGEMSSHHLSLSEGDIISYIQGVCDSFLLMADKKQIHFSFFSSVDHFTMAFDADKMGKIVMNLLANAFKFTPEGGRVTVMLEHLQEENEVIEIKVADTGIGVSDEDKEHIFDRFYQTENKEAGEDAGGTGIGLSLVKDFVTLHGGDVTVFDNIGKGAVFVVHIPVKHVDIQYHPINTMPVPGLLSESSGQQVDEVDRSQFPLLLVVDDNADFRTFMESSLGLQYRVKLASNGKEAWNFLQNCEEMPDLVVSDIMMPEMDGNELCKLIKQDKRTAHIPVILLSAKQTTESKVEGLSIGADDYVTKPFNMTILVLRIRKLIELSRYNASKGTIDPAPSEIVITSLDEKLIEKAIKYVEDNISRSDLSVEELSRELGMSRVHLYKKLLQITGKTPIEFIRVIRLKRAAQLLRDSQLHVSEIAFQVGFNNPKYFSRYFKEEFGVLPSAYQKKEVK